MFGSGGFFFQSNIPPAGSLAPTTLVNGLHVDAGKGKMGGGLIENVQLTSNGFYWRLSDDGGSNIAIDFVPAQSIIGIGGDDGDQGAQLEILPSARGIRFVDWRLGSTRTFGNFDNLNFTYTYGDIESVSGNVFAQIACKNPVNYFRVAKSGKNVIFCDMHNFIYQFGDIGGVLNSTHLEIKDNLKTINIFSNSLTSYLKIDAINLDYILGNSTNNIDVNEAAGTINGNLAGVIVFQAQSTGIKTTQPSANGAGTWQLGKKIAAAVVLDVANYIEVNIDGATYKLALVN